MFVEKGLRITKYSVNRLEDGNGIYNCTEKHQQNRTRRKIFSQRISMIIEDPLEYGKNVARNIDDKKLQQIINVFSKLKHYLIHRQFYSRPFQEWGQEFSTLSSN